MATQSNVSLYALSLLAIAGAVSGCGDLQVTTAHPTAPTAALLPEVGVKNAADTRSWLQNSVRKANPVMMHTGDNLGGGGF